MKLSSISGKQNVGCSQAAGKTLNVPCCVIGFRLKPLRVDLVGFPLQRWPIKSTIWSHVHIDKNVLTVHINVGIFVLPHFPDVCLSLHDTCHPAFNLTGLASGHTFPLGLLLDDGPWEPRICPGHTWGEKTPHGIRLRSRIAELKSQR